MKRATQSWAKQKDAEVRFLTTLSRQLREERLSHGRLPTLATRKLRAVRGLKARRGGVASESSFASSRAPQTLAGLSFAYEYQRLNLSFPDAMSNQPYRGLDSLSAAKGAHLLFTNCGQSATTLAILALKDILRRPTFEFQSTCYHETVELLMHLDLPYRTPPSRRGRSPVLFLDSSVDALPVAPELLRRRPRFCIVDTTCWSLGSAALRACVRTLLRAGSDVILVRSHIKLDCLGTELNRLGSLLCLSASVPTATSPVVRFVHRVNAYATQLGCRADLGAVYPFFKAAEYHRLSEAWHRRLRESNARFLKLVERQVRGSEGGTAIKRFPHRLFSYFLFPSSSEPALKVAAARLVANLKKQKLPAMLIASFPWDFVCVTVFEKRDLGHPHLPGVPTMRISIPDMSAADLERCALVFTRWLRDGLGGAHAPGA